MKSIIALTALLSFSAFADVPTFGKREATCEVMQTAIQNYGSVNVRLDYLFGASEVVLVTPERQNCRGAYENRTMYVRSSDGYNCRIGKFCDRREIDRD